MFFHGPPRIVLKFGTVVEHDKKIARNFIFLIGHVVSEPNLSFYNRFKILFNFTCGAYLLSQS